MFWLHHHDPAHIPTTKQRPYELYPRINLYKTPSENLLGKGLPALFSIGGGKTKTKEARQHTGKPGGMIFVRLQESSFWYSSGVIICSWASAYQPGSEQALDTQCNCGGRRSGPPDSSAKSLCHKIVYCAGSQHVRREQLDPGRSPSVLNPGSTYISHEPFSI